MAFLKRHLWIFSLLGVASFMYLLGLGRLPLQDADEATFAMIAREMIERGDYLTLRFFGEPWVDKPPLLFWLMAGSTRLFGMHEFALRFPSALFGILAVGFTAGILYELTKRKDIAWAGGMMLALFPLFLAAARNVRMDVPVTASILAAVFFFLKGFRAPRYAIGAGVAIGIGILFKSVIALFALPAFLAASLMFRNWRWLRNPSFWRGIVLGAAIALPWHFYEAWVLGKSFFLRYFGFHLGRLSENIIGSRITDAYIGWVFLKYGIPWNAVFAAALLLYLSWFFFLRRRGEPAPLWRVSSAMFLTFAVISGVMLASTTKLVTYFIPSYPFLVLFTAVALWAFLESRAPRLQTVSRILFFFLLAVAGFFSAREAFFDSKLYITRAASDEKSVGEYLSRAPRDPVYFYEYPHDQTIQYYAGRRIEGHLAEGSKTELVPPLFLVIPTPLLRENPGLRNFSQPYRGEYLTLVYLTSPSSP